MSAIQGVPSRVTVVLTDAPGVFDALSRGGILPARQAEIKNRLCTRRSSSIERQTEVLCVGRSSRVMIMSNVCRCRAGCRGVVARWSSAEEDWGVDANPEYVVRRPSSSVTRRRSPIAKNGCSRIVAVYDVLVDVVCCEWYAV
jgi:hypothetical protein